MSSLTQPATVIPIAPASGFQRHILNVIRAEMREPFCLLDMGCGTGLDLALLATHFPESDFYGYDVNDATVQPEDYASETFHNLRNARPGINWNERIKLIGSRDPWPYPSDFFDIVFSNQTLEHIWDHDFAFREMARVLKPGGKAFHLFPMKHSVIEWHIGLPLVHRINNAEIRKLYIRVCERLRLNIGLARHDPRRPTSDGLWVGTNYLTAKELYRLCHRYHLRCSFPYTAHPFLKHLGIRLSYERSPLRDWFLSFLFRYFHSVTAILEKIA